MPTRWNNVLKMTAGVALSALAAGCSVNEHIFNGQSSPAQYPTTANLPTTAPDNPLSKQQVVALRSKLNTLGGEHSTSAIKDIEKSGR